MPDLAPSEREARFIAMFRVLTPAQQDALEHVAQGMVGHPPEVEFAQSAIIIRFQRKNTP
jgi:hypothetical protein